ncbi:MAG: hypothetical protein L0G89_07235 [Janibacter sp.]|nr:hypothetical protein [Janibacter sp.]
MKTRTVSSAVRETGQVAYSVSDVGTFTLGYHPGRHPEEDSHHLVVLFGDETNTEICRDWRRPLLDSPTFFGIRLIGRCTVEVDDVLAYLSRPPERRSSWWVAAQRQTADGAMADVPDGTRRHLAHTIAHLAEDFLDRPDAAELLQAHRRHHGPSRTAAAQERLAGIEEEIATWTVLAQRERGLVVQHQAWTDGQRHVPDPAAPADIERRRRWGALTHAGAHYLASTFPQPR